MDLPLHTSNNAPSIEAYYSSMAAYWNPVCPSALLGENPLGRELLGRRIVLARLNGKVAVFDDLCRHLGAALSLGRIEESRFLRCPYHGWLYNEEGRCVDIPSRGGAPIPKAACLNRYPAKEFLEMIWVCLMPRAKYELPHFPEFEDSFFYQLDNGKWKECLWKASPQRIILGQLDDTHFAWVHPTTIGHPAQTESPDHKVIKVKGYILSTFSVSQRKKAPSSGFSSALSAKEEELSTVHYTISAGPNWIHLRKDNGKGEIWALIQLLSPIAYNKSLMFWKIARNYDKDSSHDPFYEKIQLQIMEEDKRVIESQRPWLLPPISSSLSLYLRPSDLPLIEYHKWMEEEKVHPF